MTPQLNRKAFVAGLIDLVSVSIETEQIEDAALILAGIRVLRPNLVELDVLEGWIAIKSGRFEDAVRTLRSLESSPTQWSMGKAMTALCQRRLQDPAWRNSANEVRSGNCTPEALALVDQLQQQARSEDAGAHANASSPLPVPMVDFGCLMYMRA